MSSLSFFGFCQCSSSEIRPQIRPSRKYMRKLGDEAPASDTVADYEVHELLVLFNRPWTSLPPYLLMTT
ncbi:hypothetical protein NL676_032559 [Syzygium grande]|nr:hypothetical protein NL676_032559 [Syzygium grande]